MLGQMCPLELEGLRLTSRVCPETDLERPGSRDLIDERDRGPKTVAVSSGSGGCSDPRELHTIGVSLPPRGPAGDVQASAQE